VHQLDIGLLCWRTDVCVLNVIDVIAQDVSHSSLLSMTALVVDTVIRDTANHSYHLQLIEMHLDKTSPCNDIILTVADGPVTPFLMDTIDTTLRLFMAWHATCGICKCVG